MTLPSESAAPGGERCFAVVALFAPTSIGASITRAEWPAHVTLVSNFAVETTTEQVIRTVRRVLADTVPAVARLAGPAMFGPRADIPVQLVEAGPFLDLHERLAASVERLPRFRAEEPEYWHADYRPHVTRRFAGDVREGDVWPVHCIATARLTPEFGTIVDVVEMPHSPPNP